MIVFLGEITVILPIARSFQLGIINARIQTIYQIFYYKYLFYSKIGQEKKKKKKKTLMVHFISKLQIRLADDDQETVMGGMGALQGSHKDLVPLKHVL